MTAAIAFRNIDRSETLESSVRTHIQKLRKYDGRLIGCHVLVEFTHRRHARGNRVHVRIALAVPGDAIVVAHEPSFAATATDARLRQPPQRRAPRPERRHAAVAIREAFEIARRPIQDYGRRQRGRVKTRAIAQEMAT